MTATPRTSILRAPGSQHMTREADFKASQNDDTLEGPNCNCKPATRYPYHVHDQQAIYAHDVFNLVALAIVNFLNFLYLANGEGFMVFWWATMVYFMIDFIWITNFPYCVKSPRVIQAHHLVSAVYTFLPFFYPEQAPKMSYVMTVEVNTWLLIARRVMPSTLVSFLFYSTWIIIRNIFLPYLIWPFYLEYKAAATLSGSVWHPIALAPLLQVALCMLNAQWTIDLFKNTFRRSLQPKSNLL